MFDEEISRCYAWQDLVFAVLGINQFFKTVAITQLWKTLH